MIDCKIIQDDGAPIKNIKQKCKGLFKIYRTYQIMSNQLVKTNSSVKVSALKPSPAAALEAFNLIVTEYSNYKKVVETE